MSKGLRVLLHILQLITVLGALLYLASAVSSSLAEIELPGLGEGADHVGYATAFGIVSVALSPALWSLKRGGPSAAAPAAGGYDRVSEQPQAAPQPPRPSGGSSFEPVSADRGPAPPASSYGQPSGPGFGAQPSGGMPPASPPRGDSPWGGR